MAGGVLPLTNDPMPNINTNKQGWGTDAAGTDLTEGDKYKDLINIKGAKFLDLTRSSSMKIDDADDLKDALLKYDVEMSIAFNDNPDNDEFRKAYIVVITKLEEKDTTPVGPETSGVVKLVGDAVGQATISDDTVTTLAGSGKTTASFTLNLPEWAAPNVGDTPANTTKHIVVKYDIYVDGQLWDSNKEVSYSGSSVPTANGNVLAVKDAKGATASTQGKIATAELKDFEVLAADNRLIGKKVEIRITDVTYDEVRVQYQDDKGNEVVNGTATRTQFLATGADGTLVLANICSTDKYNVAVAKATVTGAKKGSGVDAITDVALADISDARADGNGWVTVKVSGLTTTAKLSATTATYGSTPKGLFAATKIGDILGGDYKDNNDTVLISATGNAANATNTGAIAATADGQLTAKLDAGDIITLKTTVAKDGGASDVAGIDYYKITVTATTADGKVNKSMVNKFQSGQASADGAKTITFQADTDVTVSITIEPIKAPVLQTAVWNATTAELTLTFDQDIDKATVQTSAFNVDVNWTGVSIGSDTDNDLGYDEANPKVVIVRLKGVAASTIDANSKITLTTGGGGLESDGIEVGSNVITFTSKDSGSCNVTHP